MGPLVFITLEHIIIPQIKQKLKKTLILLVAKFCTLDENFNNCLHVINAGFK